MNFPLLNSRPLVPVVRLEGAISATGSRFERALNLAAVAPALEKAFAIKRAEAVALIVNSPGGAPVQSNLIHDRIRSLAEIHDKTVLVFCEDVAASGGYWIALAGDEIYADPGSIVGSIGVIAATFGFVGLLEKAGVERRLYTSGENKSFLDPFLPEKDADVARLRALQDGLHDLFKAHVRARRGDKLAAGDEELFTGDFWLGGRAKELGLIDGLGSAHEVLTERYGDKVEIKPIGAEKKSIVTRLLSGGAAAMAGEIDQRARFSRYGL